MGSTKGTNPINVSKVVKTDTSILSLAREGICDFKGRQTL